VFIKVRRRKHEDRVYEYLDIVENHKVQGKVVRQVLGSLGRRDLLSPRKVDGLIEHLRQLASPEGRRGIRLGEMRFRQVREYGPVLVARQLWQELGLDQMLAGLPHPKSVDLEEAVFRMVANRLCQPQSKLGLVDWSDERGNRHRGWQGEVEWPSAKGELDYHHYLRAMDFLHPHRQQIEDQVFGRVTEIFSLPLNLVLFDLTSTYFEGDGVCELAGFGYSRDHRDDRRQVVLGLAVTQEGLPIMQRVFPGNTNDATTLAPIAQELREPFGLPEAVLVGDKGSSETPTWTRSPRSGSATCWRSVTAPTRRATTPSSSPSSPDCRCPGHPGRWPRRRARSAPNTSWSRSSSSRAPGMWSSTRPSRPCMTSREG